MVINNLINLFYSVKVSCICNFLSGIAMLYIALFCLPAVDIREGDIVRICMLLGISFSIGLLPAFVYNIIRFRMVKLRELNYGMFRYTLSTLTFIAPMLVYYIAWLRGFRME